MAELIRRANAAVRQIRRNESLRPGPVYTLDVDHTQDSDDADAPGPRHGKAS